MKTIGKRTKFYLIIDLFIALVCLIPSIWYGISLSHKYSTLLLAMCITFGFISFLFFLFFIIQIAKRNNGVYQVGLDIIFKYKGKRIQIPLKEVKSIKYAKTNLRHFTLSFGTLFIDDYRILDIQDVKQVAVYLNQQWEMLNGESSF